MMNPEQIAAAASADIAEAERLASAHSQLARILGWALVAGALLIAGYCSGGAHQRQVTLAAHADSVRQVAARTIKASQQGEQADAVSVATAKALAAQAKDAKTLAAYRDSLARAKAALSRLAVTSDSTVTIHDTTATVPREVIVQLMNDAAVIKADSALIAKQADELSALTSEVDALQLQVTDTQHERDGWKLTANVDAAQLAVSQPKHRFGFKSGLAVGAAVVLGILHFAK